MYSYRVFNKPEILVQPSYDWDELRRHHGSSSMSCVRGRRRSSWIQLCRPMPSRYLQFERRRGKRRGLRRVLCWENMPERGKYGG